MRDRISDGCHQRHQYADDVGRNYLARPAGRPVGRWSSRVHVASSCSRMMQSAGKKALEALLADLLGVDTRVSYLSCG